MYMRKFNILDWFVEYWLPIKGYEGLYEVSNWGRVRSLNYNHTGKLKILKTSPNNKGYLGLSLCKNGKIKHHNIHRLVAEALLSNPNHYPCINHKDCDPSNNCVWNLEWCSYAYNNVYEERAKRSGAKQRKPVLQYTKDGQFVNYFNSARIAQEKIGISFKNINAVCLGKIHSAGGFIWKYPNSQASPQ